MASVEATRRILEEQLRLVLEQKVLLENHLADLNTQPQPSALLPQKRSTPALGAASKQPSKRQRVRTRLHGPRCTEASHARPHEGFVPLFASQPDLIQTSACGDCPPLMQVGDERTRRVDAIWAQVGTVLKQLLKQRDASVFAQPVDAVKLQVTCPLTPAWPPRTCSHRAALPGLWIYPRLHPAPKRRRGLTVDQQRRSDACMRYAGKR